MKTDVVLLPGFHGSTRLFESFVAIAPSWARCHPIALPTEGDQSYDSLSDALEPRLRHLEGLVLFGESFSAPLAARLAERLGRKIALLVFCNPLIEPPLSIAPSLATPLLRSRLIPTWIVAAALTGGDRRIAASVVREVRALPKETVARRLGVALSATREDLASRLQPPVLGIIGARDRLVSPSLATEVFGQVDLAVCAVIDAPHLAAQVTPSEVWAVIDAEFRQAA